MIKVIVVDDERFVRMGIVGETDWASLGCEVVGEAENGLDALELVHEKNPELIICDIRMPKMNGLEMLKKLREEKNPVQVIFLTAFIPEAVQAPTMGNLNGRAPSPTMAAAIPEMYYLCLRCPAASILHRSLWSFVST